VAQNYRRCALGARVTVSGVRRNLLMARIDELDRTLFQSGKHGDIGMPAQAEDVFDATVFQILYQLVRNQVFHFCLQ
jgi:hypothetical protein